MPLLAPEPTVYPENLFAEQGPDSPRWWVFQTRPRAEKSFARLLLKSQTPYFLPVHTQSWRKNGRQFQSSLPLFPNYVFVSGEPAVRDVAFATHLVVRDVPANDQSRLSAELASLNRLLGGGDSLRPEEGLSKGTRVLVVEGIYAGVEGRVLEAGGELRVCVEISLLGRGVSVLVERWMIKPLES